MYQQKPWMGQPAPPGYVAGLGRGATGFTTRSDIGPARDAGEITDDRRRRPAHLLAQLQDQKRSEAAAEEADDATLNDANYDAEYGYGGSLFSKNAPYEADDQEADAIYDAIDARMDERRREHREKRIKEDLEKLRAERPKIQQQFSDLKRQLKDISASEWDDLPEVSGVRATKRPKTSTHAERFTPVPDSVIARTRDANATTTQIDPRTAVSGGLTTPMGIAATPMTDLSTIGDARNSMLSIKLDQASSSVSGQSVVDPKSFLTDLQSLTPKSNADVSDTAKARQLLEKVRETNPHHAPGWVASARLEEVVGKLGMARTIALKGCEKCPRNEDMWMEAARLHTPESAKAIVAQAVSQGRCPLSVRLWIKAADLETEVKNKKRVLRKALEAIPESVRLWKLAVELEEVSDARVMLQRGVECCPKAVDLWLALARLESYENAQRVLNQARVAVPTDRLVWFTAAKLEEAHGNVEMVPKLIERAFKNLTANGVQINRESWMEDAEKTEQSGSPLTAQSIVRAVIAMGIDEEDRLHTWSSDAESFIAHSAFDCGRAVYAFALQTFPSRSTLWLSSAHLEKQHGTRASLLSLLQKAVRHCPQTEVLWLMGAKEEWLDGNVAGARAILAEAFKANPNSEDIWLAAIKLESEIGEYTRARKLLERARTNAPTGRVWMKSAKLEWQLNDLDAAESLLSRAVSVENGFQSFDKLWMMRGQIAQCKGDTKLAIQLYHEGLRKCPQSIPLWILASRAEESQSLHTKARATLEKARARNPNNPTLWLEAVRIEERTGNSGAAQGMLAKAMQECPQDGPLWAHAIATESRVKRKAKSVDAVKRCEHNAHVLMAVAAMMWSERKVAQARNWFTRALKIDPQLGDAWAALYRFELQYGTPEQQSEVEQRCVMSEPNRGEKWNAIAKLPEHWKAKPDAILKLVAQTMEPL